MALSKLCVIALFMKDEERIAKNSNSITELNSVLPTASHIIDGLWFVAAQQVVTFTVVCPGKKKETVDIDPPIGMIKLNMSCTALSTYLTLLPYYHNESKSDIQDHFIEILRNMMALRLKFKSHSQQPSLILPKVISLKC